MAVASLESRTVLFVDDDNLFADAAADILRSRGYVVETAGSLSDAATHDPTRFDCVVVDHQLPDGSGLALASQLDRSRTRVVLVSATPRLEAAVEALRLGVLDFLPKPIDFDSLVGILQPDAVLPTGAVLPPGTVLPPGASLQRESRPRPTAGETHALLPTMADQAPLLAALARSRCSVLINGETGSGKGHIARTIHAMGRNTRPMVSVNCAAIPAGLVEAELFGVERGAFTGAESRPGLLEIAHQSTLFLDEIGELPLALQAKLLGFLDDGNVRRVGGTTWKTFSVRIIAATNRDLDAAAAAGDFRADLLHRLDVARIQMKPLRERTADIAPLTDSILERLGQRDGVDYALACGEIEKLAAHDWPGNVRELSNAIERSTLLGPPDALAPSAFARGGRAPRLGSPAIDAPAPMAITMASADDTAGDMTLERVEREHVLKVVTLCNGNRTMAASLLGIGASTLRRKLADWAID